MTSPLQIEKIGQIAIAVKDVERAVDFYEKTLGLKLLFKAPPGLAFFNCGGVRLMLSVPENGVVLNSVFYFRVSDLEKSFESLRSLGVVITDEPHKIADMPDHELWMGFFLDSEGNALALMTEKKTEKKRA